MNYYTNIAVASFKRDYNATIWGIIAVVLGKQSKTTADGIGRVFADLYCPLMSKDHPSQKWDCGGRSGNANWYLMEWDKHLLEYVGTTTYCGMLRIACLDLVLWLQYFCFWGGQIHLLRGSEALMRWFGQCRSVQIKRLHSYVIGEETCKWQCVYCIVIYWEWG